MHLYYLLNIGLAFLARLYTGSVTVSITDNEMCVYSIVSAWLINRAVGYATGQQSSIHVEHKHKISNAM